MQNSGIKDDVRASAGVWFVRVFAVLAVLYMLAAVRIDFFGPDTPIYFAYTSSVVTDGDLNTVNEVVEDVRFGGPNAYVSPFEFFNVSYSHNYPDYHNHGGIVFWIPAYVTGKALYRVWDWFGFFEKRVKGFGTSSTAGMGNRFWSGRDSGQVGFARGMMSFSTVLFAFLCVVGTFFVCRGYFPGWVCALSIFAVFWGTPYFYYVLGQPGNAQILSSLLALICIFWLRLSPSMVTSQYFFYGLFFGMCCVVKIDLWFYAFFISSYWFYLKAKHQTSWARGFAMFGGFLIPFGLKIVNDTVKYGVLRQGEFHLISPDFFYFSKQIFSAYRGFFYTSPVFYLCFLGGILVLLAALREKRRTGSFEPGHVFLLCLVFAFVMKIFLMSFRFAWGGGTPGARILISEFALQVFLIGCFFKYLRFTFRRVFAIIFCLGAVFWNMLVVAEFVAEVDLFNIARVAPLAFRVKHLETLFRLVLLPKQIAAKILLFSIPFAFCFCIVAVNFAKAKNFSASAFGLHSKKASTVFGKVFAVLAVYMCAFYLGVTFLNVKNNQRNIEKLRQDGYFEYARVVPPSRYEDFENLGCFDEMIEFFTVREDTAEVERLKKLKKEYLAS